MLGYFDGWQVRGHCRERGDLLATLAARMRTVQVCADGLMDPWSDGWIHGGISPARMCRAYMDTCTPTAGCRHAAQTDGCRHVVWGGFVQEKVLDTSEAVQLQHQEVIAERDEQAHADATDMHAYIHVRDELVRTAMAVPFLFR